MTQIELKPDDEISMLDIPIALRDPTGKELYLVQYPDKIENDDWTEHMLTNHGDTAHLVAFEHPGSKVWKVKSLTLEVELVAQ